MSRFERAGPQAARGETPLLFDFRTPQSSHRRATISIGIRLGVQISNLIWETSKAFSSLEDRVTSVELILGTAQIRDEYGIVSTFAPSRRATEVRKIVEKSRELGFSAIDTAPTYGTAEEFIGSTNTSQDIHTKLRAGESFLTSLRQSLLALKRDQVQLLYVHDTGLLPQLSSQLRANLSSMREHGARSLGASIYDLDDFYMARSAELFDVIQVPLNIFDTRFSSEIVGPVRREGTKIYARSIFLQGVLLTRPADLPSGLRGLAPFLEKFTGICVDWKVEPIDALVRFVVERSEVDGLVVGFSTLRELQRFSGAFEAQVPSELLDKIDRLERPQRYLTDPRNWS